MPIDALIPLSGKNPVIEPPQQVESQVLGTQQQQQQLQVGGQQLQGLQMENQQRAQDLEDQKTMRQALIQSGGDMQKFQNSIIGKVSPKTMFAFNQMQLNQKKVMADTDAQTIKNDIEKHDALRSLIQTVKSASPEKRQQAWESAIQQGQSRGLIGPGTQLSTTVPDEDDLTAYENGLALSSTQAKEHVEQQNADTSRMTALSNKQKNEAELPGIVAGSSQKVAEDAARKLAPAAGLSKDAYARAWYALDPAIAKQFPHPDDWDKDATPDQVRQVGMAPEKQATTAQGSERVRIAAAALKKAGSEAELARQAAGSGPDAAQAKIALGLLSDQKVKEEVGKQLGVFKALTSGDLGGGTPGVRIPQSAPGQNGTQLAAANNNPGNLKFANQPGAELGDGGFAKFKSPEDGLAALQSQISLDASRGATLASYISKYAPPSENDTAGYIQKAAAAVGMAPGTPLSKVDPAKLAAFQAKQESGTTVTPPAAAPVAATEPATLSPGETASRNESALKNVNPGIATEIKAVADGRLPVWPSSRMNPMNEVKRNLLMQYDPTFDFTNTAARTKTAQGFSPSGQQGQAINAFDTALRHASVLSKLIDNLNNTNFRKYNSIANWITSETGSPAVKEFDNVRHKFAEELTKAWRGTGGNESDIKAEMDALNAADSPTQLKKVMADNVELLQGKIGALEDQYKQTMGKPGNFVSATAQKAIDKIRGAVSESPKKGDVQQHNGDNYEFDGTVWRKQPKAK